MNSTALHEIPETMLIPLWARAEESRSSQPVIRDEKAEKILSDLPYDFSKFKKSRYSQLGVAVRSLLFDEAVRRFLKEKPNAVIVNMGAGLDTRYERLGLSGVQWYDLDVPEAISMRNRFFSESSTHHFIAKSVFDFSWMDDICITSAPVLFIAEGLFMYFNQNEIKLLLDQIIKHFPGSDMLMEILAPLFVGKAKHHDSLSKIKGNVEFKWGLKESRELEAWNRGIQFLEEWHYCDYYKKRWGWVGFMSRMRFFRPHISCRIVHLRFKPK